MVFILQAAQGNIIRCVSHVKTGEEVKIWKERGVPAKTKTRS